MKKLRLWMLGILAMAGIMSASGQGVIMTNDFESGSVSKVSGRFRAADIDLGWFANSTAVTPNSEWIITDGTLQNSATNNGAYPDYLPAEGAVVRAVASGDDTNNVIDISFDYDVSTNDVLYIHFWAYIFTGDTLAGNLANFQSGNGGLGDNSGGIVGMTSYKLLSSVQVTGSGTYTNAINIPGLALEDIETVTNFDYYQIAFAKNEDGLPGTTSVDNLAITSSYEAPTVIPPPPSGVVWENDMSSDPVGDGWVIRNGKDNYTMGDGVLILGEGAFSALIDTDPYNGFDAITKVDFRWRTTSHSDPGANYGAGIWLNCDGDVPDYYPTILSSLLNTNDNTQTVKMWDPGNGAPIVTVPGFGTGMIDAMLTIDAYNETMDYILTDGTLSVTGSVSRTAAGTAGTAVDHTLFTAGPTCEIDYVRLEANAFPEEVYFAVDPDALSFSTADGSAVDDSVDVTYNARTNLQLTITVEDESHPGTFSVLSEASQIVVLQGSSELEFQFDPSVSNLVGGTTATGLAVIAWSELDGGDSGQVTVALTGVVNYEGAPNDWTGSGDGSSWGDPANWDLDRVPGALADDSASISGGATVNVLSDFSTIFPWSNVLDDDSTLNIYADFLGGGDLTIGSSGDGFVNQTNGAASVGAFSMSTADSSMTLSGGSFTVEDAFTLSGSLIIDGGDFIIDNADAGGAWNGTLGTVTITSGSFSGTRTVAQQAGAIQPAFVISGGSLTVQSQHYWTGGLTIIGSEPIINQKYMNSTCTINMIMDETGIATIKQTGWNHLNGLTLTVDGSAYTGGSGEFLLFDGAMNSTSTAVTVTGFPDGVEAYVTQSTTANEVKLIIDWPGYDGWIGKFGLSGADAEHEVDYDMDGENNFAEYVFGGDPTNAAVVGYIYPIALVEDGGVTYIEYIYPRLMGSEEDSGVMYEAQFNAELQHGIWSAGDVVEMGAAPIDDEYEAVTNRVDITGKNVGFMRSYAEEL